MIFWFAQKKCAKTKKRKGDYNANTRNGPKHDKRCKGLRSESGGNMELYLWISLAQLGPSGCRCDSIRFLDLAELDRSLHDGAAPFVQWDPERHTRRCLQGVPGGNPLWMALGDDQGVMADHPRGLPHEKEEANLGIYAPQKKTTRVGSNPSGSFYFLQNISNIILSSRVH